MDAKINQLQAEHLVTLGELTLLKRDARGLDLFQRASEYDPNNAELLFRQALSLYEFGNEEDKKVLLLANRKLRRASLVDQSCFKIWHLWGTILLRLGKSSGEFHYFLEAKEKYARATALSEDQEVDVLTDLYWDCAMIWKKIAERSGEAVDLQIAIESFRNASLHSDQLPSDFWNDFGQTCARLACHLNDIRLYVKAIHCFKHAISTSASFYSGWTSLATTLGALHAQTHDEDHFSQANECFAAAAQLQPQDAHLWLDWAKFLCESGRRHRDLKKLHSCIEKCQHADTCMPNNPLVKAIWAEALAASGELSERLDLLYEAQNKIAEASHYCPHDSERGHPDIWYSYGMCLNSFAGYFNDTDYYYQAIEKFQYGLSMDRTQDRHWHAIAVAYAMIGQMEMSCEPLELASRFFTKAIALKTSSFYIYDYALTLSKIGEITHEQYYLEEALFQFERALAIQKNAIYIHPEWLFHYAATLDMLGDFYEDESYYSRAIDIFTHVLMIDPDFPNIHHRLALVFSHLGDLVEETNHFYRSLHHYRLACEHEEENDQILHDWGITLINLSQSLQDPGETNQFYREAEHKLTQAAKLGNLAAYYHLSCLYSLLNQNDKAMRFLEKADFFSSLPPLEELLQDEWLDGLRSTSPFRDFLSQLEKRPNLQEER
jgi:tetratricopeptide (TPR) repeat protein